MSLQWTEALSIGHPEIDAQHRSIFARFADFIDACNGGLDQEHLRQLFAFLDDYVTHHFRSEEEMMEQVAYPGRELHRREHRHFVEKLAKLKSDLEVQGASIGVLIRTNKTLIYWLTEHIREVDTDLAGFLDRQR